MRHATLLIGLLLLASTAPAASALEWSEILFDPSGSDNGLEFIELAGGEDLTGCVVRDSASEDVLTQLQGDDSELILIVEDDGPLAAARGARVYGAGKAIGNGLGNTADELTISCNGTVLLRTSYNISRIEGHEEGRAIVFSGDEWTNGSAGGTPGAREQLPAPQEPSRDAAAPEDDPSRSGSSCNATLAITMSASRGAPGDLVSFTIISAGHATFSVDARGEAILEGDTLSRREYAFTLPDAPEARILAQARECDARQRASRTITISRRDPALVPSVSSPPAAGEEDGLPLEEEEGTAALALAGDVVLALPTPSPAAGEAITLEAVQESGAGDPSAQPGVIVDKDAGVVPWVSAFGIITLLVSGGLFLRLRREEKEA